MKFSKAEIIPGGAAKVCLTTALLARKGNIIFSKEKFEQQVIFRGGDGRDTTMAIATPYHGQVLCQVGKECRYEWASVAHKNK